MKYHIIDFIKRHSINILLMIVALYFIGFESEIIDTLLTLTAIESIAIILTGISLYTFTNLNFLTMDNKILIGMIFIAVHILVGLSILGIYIVRFSGV